MPPIQNLVATLVTFALAVLWLRLNNFAAQRGWLSSDLSRKIIHIGTGPIFVLCWLLYAGTPDARFLAALIPLAITLQFLLVGTGIIRDPSAVKSMSRSGDRREILRGPLIYGLAFVALTLVFWLHSPVGIVALMILCGGDGLADVIGRRHGSVPLPWNREKSWAGSIAMLAGGWLLAILVMAAFVFAGKFPGPFAAYLLPVTLTSLAAALVETLPVSDFDNITVTLTAVLCGLILF